MINSANTLDYSVKHINNEMLPAEMLPSTDKYNPIQASNIPQGTATRLLPTQCSELYKQYCTAKTKDIERVQVQHLQPPTKLQNNRWNYHSFCNLNATAEMEMDTERMTTQNFNNNNNNNNNNKIRNDSAFKKCYTVVEDKHVTSAGTEPNNNNNNNDERKTQIIPTATGDSNQMMTASDSGGDRRASPIHRTEDQENAFRRIEDVHNYAKLNRYSRYSHESSNSSIREEDDEEEEEGDFFEEEEEEELDLDENYESLFRNKQRSYSSSAADNLKTRNVMQKLINVRAAAAAAAAAAEETEPQVDVETVPKGEQYDKAMVSQQPDHHARRPMNAFLIFCKRHRAIVKERYKSLENRAITKILGDWWASLDINDKKCFTNLAQQNKDAFFSANPNFKWYKLPAPPLRTLNTRPSNAAERGALHEHELFEANESQCRPRCQSSTGTGNYFKLADEAQMGELSTLMSEKSHALQQALGETTQFLSAHIPPHSEELGGTLKRRLHSDNSVSSNSNSEDDAGGAALPAKKSARSCKGKIYQELINSGQISATTKKLKAPKLQNQPQNGYGRHEIMQQQQQQQLPVLEKAMAALADKGPSKRTVSESALGQLRHYDLANFDLEEKIKELPALSLDTYLLRKRSTKKKKKFTAKKRNSNSATSSSKSSSSTSLASAAMQSPPATPPKEIAPAQPAAVGSQKRKARKESITRRDVSAIENEVASLIPLTNNFSTISGCYYFNESPSASPSPPAPSTLAVNATKAISHSAPSSNTLDAQQQPLASSSISALGDFNDNISSSTSDLFILAEVAANRTELTN